MYLLPRQGWKIGNFGIVNAGKFGKIGETGGNMGNQEKIWEIRGNR